MTTLATIGKVLLFFIAIFGIFTFIFEIKDPHATYTVYLHEETNGFGFTKFDFDSKEIEKYIHKGVVPNPYFRVTGGYEDNQMYSFYYHVFSKEKKSVLINSISVGKKNRMPNRVIHINKLKKEKFLGMFWTKSLLFYSTTPSIKVSKKVLETFVNKNGVIEATITVTIDEQRKSFVFLIKPTEIKDTYFHMW